MQLLCTARRTNGTTSVEQLQIVHHEQEEGAAGSSALFCNPT